MEQLGVPCIYVEGNARDGDEGHAWNIVEINGEQYYVDATNGDQPAFLEGGAVSLEEHKTTIYDYLCLFHRNMSNYIQHPMNFRFRSVLRRILIFMC